MTYKMSDATELDELFARTHDFLCNYCSNCNTENKDKDISMLGEPCAVTGTSNGTVATVSGDTAFGQLSLPEPALDMEAAFARATAHVTESCPAQGYLPWLENNHPGNWHMLLLAEREVKAALSGGRHGLLLPEAVGSYETIYRKAYSEYTALQRFPSERASPPCSCRWCGSTDMWQGDGRMICRRCHPPAPGAERTSPR